MIFKPNIRNLSYHKVKNWYGNLVKPKPCKPPYKHVTQVGDPTLRLNCDIVPTDLIKSDEIQAVIKQLKYVFKKYDCIGLSAPQIGVPLQMFVMEFNKKNLKAYSKEEIASKEMTLQPLTVVINPDVVITDYTKLIYPESCESVKGLWADVPRYYSLVLKGFDETGQSIKLDAKGWIARVIQHEVDHLNGKLYTDIMDRKSLTCGCWEVINERNGRVDLPFGPG